SILAPRFASMMRTMTDLLPPSRATGVLRGCALAWPQKLFTVLTLVAAVLAFSPASAQVDDAYRPPAGGGGGGFQDQLRQQGYDVPPPPARGGGMGGDAYMGGGQDGFSSEGLRGTQRQG